MIQTNESSFEPDFNHFGPYLGPHFLFFFCFILPLLHVILVIHSCMLSLYVISRKTNEPNFRKWQKT